MTAEEHPGATDADGSPGAGSSAKGWAREPHHLWRMTAIWLVLSAVVDPLFWFLAGPHVPPGDMTTSASGAQFDFNVLMMAAIPVVLAVWTYLGYAIITWRASRGGPEPVGGVGARSHLKVQVAWISVTTVVVLAAFIFGTVQLVSSDGAGGAQGPNPIWTPSTKHQLVVQVIAQQWKFTYRYPSFGGMETNALVLPDNTEIDFHVTSLDVIHSFWAYQLGVKVDANPGVDNVAYTKTAQDGTFDVRCSELCGIWHGAMYDYGKVVSKGAFMKWATRSEKELADNTKYLPPFAWTYVPTANTATGVATDTSGQNPYSPTEKYGATSSAKKQVSSPATLTTTTDT